MDGHTVLRNPDKAAVKGSVSFPSVVFIYVESVYISGVGVVGKRSFALFGHMTTERYASKVEDSEFLSRLQL